MAIPSLSDSLRVARVHEYGLLPYAEALDLQRRMVEERLGGSTEDAVLALEHPHTYTLGRSADASNLLLSPEACRARGIEVFATDRGGDVTYHGPGQLVLYPIFDLRRWKRDVAAYVRSLEEVVVRALADFGIRGRRGESARGVWVGEAKIASLGVRIRQWVAMHGVALNVNPDLSYYEGIHPCGARDARMTSMIAEGLPGDRTGDVREALLARFAEVFGRILIRAGDPMAGSRPAWLRASLAGGERGLGVHKTVREKRLHTVCASARCPNLGECWNRGTATFLINGAVCTRSCGFCAVRTGRPEALDPEEPRRVADAAAAMALDYVVVTSVTRDDLSDGGASQFAATIHAVRNRLPGAGIEVLIPDFQGDAAALRRVFEARPDILNHNVETVERLYPSVRPQARYERTLEVLRAARRAGLAVKSGLMLGLGERRSEVEQTLRHVRDAGCRILTLGQYLRPSLEHHPIIRYVPPEEFEEWRERALAMGFAEAACAPLVRSSYRAQAAFHKMERTPKADELE
ncbi:MAG: lipoyl synthase [Candidatus Sumerlaeota bacterium]|nr:lipoyl synthase [Candidatus Sumerlaeota bacterium]